MSHDVGPSPNGESDGLDPDKVSTAEAKRWSIETVGTASTGKDERLAESLNPSP
jgi:hypothetical protein